MIFILQSDTTTVNITVLDVNDNPPRFKHTSYSCHVTEGTTNTIVINPNEVMLFQIPVNN